MTLIEAKLRLGEIRLNAKDDPENAGSLERRLLCDALEAAKIGAIDIKTINEVLKVREIDFKRY